MLGIVFAKRLQPNCCRTCLNVASRASPYGSFKEAFIRTPIRRPLGLLRPGTPRPCDRRAADEDDELAPIQPIELHL